ncbi:hypothetical protein DFH09DRAFT_1069297 [Mycena vulgaris]|nr:hypothetical protein DFH09DRAFT_1093910 [Mycena vulgaris]KAJ6601739.1 hypothetical protein DFH09DRAFT_1069297 [Mycena vulgaris]
MLLKLQRYLYYLQLCCRRTPKRAVLTACDLTLTVCVLALPLAALQWSVLASILALAAGVFDATGRIPLLVLLGLLVGLAVCAVAFFWRRWARNDGMPRNIQREWFGGAEGAISRRFRWKGRAQEVLRMNVLRKLDDDHSV